MVRSKLVKAWLDKETEARTAVSFMLGREAKKACYVEVLFNRTQTSFLMRSKSAIVDLTVLRTARVRRKA